MTPRICHQTLPEDGMTRTQRDAANYFRHRIAQTLAAAAEEGVIITVETAPLLPRAMGNYDLVVNVRPLRNFKEPA